MRDIESRKIRPCPESRVAAPGLYPGDDFIAITHVDSFSLYPLPPVFDLAPLCPRGPWGTQTGPSHPANFVVGLSWSGRACRRCGCHAFPSENRANPRSFPLNPVTGFRAALWLPQGPRGLGANRFAMGGRGSPDFAWAAFASQIR